MLHTLYVLSTKPKHAKGIYTFCLPQKAIFLIFAVDIMSMIAVFCEISPTPLAIC
ncbi:hypothetical protein SAMN05720468_11119 [Fibrobacter sp. UWEL]|nr:hypothetical protein SAMN05720468_11119 [Fibrobacter sp. UWEL]